MSHRHASHSRDNVPCKVGVSRVLSSRWRWPTPGPVCRPVQAWRVWASSRLLGSELLTLVSRSADIKILNGNILEACVFTTSSRVRV